MEYDMEESENTYKVNLLKTFGEVTIEKEITLPFKPFKDLLIRISDAEYHQVKSSMWDHERNRFDAECLTCFESIARDTSIVQPHYTQADYDKIVELHLKIGWSVGEQNRKGV